MLYISGVITKTYLEGNDDSVAADDAAAQAAATQAAAEAKAKEDAEAAKNVKKTFTQDEVNKLLAEDRRKHKAQVEKSVSELEQLKKSKSLSDQERANLTTKIEELQNSVLTKEQLAAKNEEKLQKKLADTTAELTADRDTWKTRFHTTQIQQAITSEALAHKAFDSDALIAILGPNTKLHEELDDEGKPTGHFVPKTKFTDRDKEGKPFTLELTVPEVVTKMKEIPKYGYLFETTAAAGLGAGTRGGGRGEVDPANMTTEQYREHRKKTGFAKA